MATRPANPKKDSIADWINDRFIALAVLIVMCTGGLGACLWVVSDQVLILTQLIGSCQ